MSERRHVSRMPMCKSGPGCGNGLPVLCPILTPCQIITPLVLVGVGLGVGEGLGLGNQIAISTRGVIIWQGVENGHNTRITRICGLAQVNPHTLTAFIAPNRVCNYEE